MSVNININFDEDYIAKKAKKVTKNFSNSSIRKYIHFLQDKDRFAIIPYTDKDKQAIDSLKEIDVHFLNDDKIFCNRTIGKKCVVCDFIEKNLKKHVAINKDIQDIYYKISPKTYILVPVVLLNKDNIDDSIKYVRWQLPLYEKFLNEYISSREYGVKCLTFQIGFEMYENKSSTDYKFLDISPIQIDNIKFDTDDIINKFKSLPDPYNIFIEGLGYINNDDEISNLVKNFLSLIKNGSYTDKIIKKKEENDIKTEVKDDELLKELNDKPEDNVKTAKEEIDKIFNEEENNENVVDEKDVLELDSILGDM